MGTTWGLVERRAAETPDLLALADERNRRCTWADLRDHAERAAAGLANMGVAPGDVVSWQLPTRIDTIVLSLALARLGAVQNPIIPLYRGREVGSLLRTTQARWFIHPGVWRGFDFGAMASSFTGALPDLRVVAFDRVVPDGDPATLLAPPTDPHEPRWLYATSGTTSEPKAVRHSDASLIASGEAMARALQSVPPDINTIPFPYSHIGGPLQLCASLITGAGCVLVESFAPASAAFEVFDRHGATGLGGGPAFYLALLAEQERLGGRSPMSALRRITGGGAPNPAELFWRTKERLGVRITHAYGMTECPIVACGSPTDTDEQLANSEGAPVDGIEVLVADGELQPVAVGVDGDVLVRGPMVAQGYVQEEATTAAFLPGGWFFTGDRGHLWLDGHLTITGRSKDLIIRKGENISPREIEDVLMSHPSVGAVAVIGLPDPERGERVCAVVEPLVSGARLTFDEMVAHCRLAGLMTQKIPEQLELVDALPRNPTMKVLKRALVEQLTAARAPRGD